MPSVSFTGVIARPVEQVFSFVTDVSTHPRWQKSVVEASLVSEPPLGVGSTGREVRRFMGRQVETMYRVTAFEPNRRFLTQSLLTPVPGEIGADFEAVDENSTRVTLRASFQFSGVFKLAGPIAVRMLRAESEANFGALKALLEQGGAPGAAGHSGGSGAP